MVIVPAPSVFKFKIEFPVKLLELLFELLKLLQHDEFTLC